MNHMLIRQTRRSQKLTTREVAEKAGCSTQAVSQYETGRTTLISPTAQAILDALDLELVLQPRKAGNQ